MFFKKIWIAAKARWDKIMDKYVYNTEIPPHAASFNYLAICTMFFVFVSCLLLLIFDKSRWQEMLVILILVTASMCGLRYSYKVNKLHIFVHVSSMLFGLIFLPTVFLLGGGIQGSAGYWFILGLIFTSVGLQGRILHITIFIQGAIYAVCLLVSYFFPHISLGADAATNLSSYYISSVYAIATIAAIVVFFIKYQYRVFVSVLNNIEGTIKQAEEMREEAERASVVKSDFLANMSHEIRTPMNAILGMTRIALKHEDTPKDVRENLEDILSSGNTLLSIVNDILDFSKIESGKMEIVPSQYQLSSLIHDVCTVIYFRLQDKHVKFVQDIDKTIPNNLYGDEVRVKQILLNVLGNAVKFTDDGEIKLAIRWRKVGDEAMLTISVSDTGQGIKPDNLEKIFTRFGQVEASKNHAVEGTGLGLTITRNLLELMNGVISVESTYGVGSDFVIVLPQKIVSEKEIYGNSFHRKYSDHKGVELEGRFTYPDASVLIVDDNMMNLKVANGLLIPYGIHADLASSGEQCLQMCRERLYDLIFMDHMMPVMDGVETLWKLRAYEKFTTPVIAVTANAMQGVKQQYINWGFTDYISKPIQISELDRVIKQFLDSYKVEKTENTEAEKNEEKVKKVKEEKTPDNTSILFENLPEEKADVFGPPGKSTREWTSGCAAAINFEHGLEYALWKTSFYFETLDIYIQEASRCEAELNKYCELNNMADYAIQVHSLKSNSRMIGALELGDFAYELELRSKNNESDYIAKYNPVLIDNLHAVVEGVKQYIEQHK